MVHLFHRLYGVDAPDGLEYIETKLAYTVGLCGCELRCVNDW